MGTLVTVLGIWLGAGGRYSVAAEPAPLVPTAKPAEPVTSAGLEVRFVTQIKPLLAQHCYSCHGNGKHKGELSLEPFTNLHTVQWGRDKWLHITDMLKQKLMPPEEKPALAQADLDKLVVWIDDALNYCDCSGPRDPGRVAIHRLNRSEYNNTIRDLLGVDFKPAQDFPADDTGYGFDNIADVLTMSPLLAEKYLAAADEATAKLIPSVDALQPHVKRYAEVEMSATGDRNTPAVLVSEGETSLKHEFVADGEYELRINGFERKLGDEDAKIEIRLDGKEVGTAEFTAKRGKPQTVKVKFPAKAGMRKVSAVFINPKTSDEDPATKKRTARSVNIEWVEMDGPYNAIPPPPSVGYRKIFIAKPSAGVTDEAAARTILARFAGRAYRRPAQPDEVDSLMKVFKAMKADGETFEQSVRLSLAAVLVSPQFLFRIELDPTAPPIDPANPAPYLISDYELASRLSYFFWSSAPDDELLGFAQSRRLRDPKVLEHQVQRMLHDSRAAALVQNFAGQWLELRNLDDYKPDPKVYPGWSDDLRAAMKKETELFVGNVISEDRSVLELLNGDYTFVNGRLAKLYGMDDVHGNEFRKVSLAGTRRGGVLTQASVLTVTAMPTRTSPVRRGKFVLDNILGTPPPPPPPDVPALSENSKDISKATLKVRLEEHRKNPNCAVCHLRMDPIGFSLENFDAIGKWRDRDGKFAVDSLGRMPDGTELDGAAGLQKMLLAHQDQFVDTLVRKLLTYALGRGLEYYDQCTVKDIDKAVREKKYAFSSMVMAIVTSDAFQKRRLLRPDEIRVRQELANGTKEKKDVKK